MSPRGWRRVSAISGAEGPRGGGGRPRGLLRIAHGAGNRRRSLRLALMAGVDFVEADLHLGGRGPSIHHGRRLGPFPLVYDRWHIKPYLRPLTLEELLAAGPRGLFLDLKMDWGWPLGPPPAGLGPILERLREGGFLQRTVLSSQDWALLDGARELEPGLGLSYSVGYGWHLEALGRRLEGGESPTMVTIRHSLLDPELTLALRQRGVTVIAWTVDSPRRAQELLGWGVGGIVSNNLALLGDLA